MDSGSGQPHSGVKDLAVRVMALEGGQQAGVHVEQLTAAALSEESGEDAHEAGQAHQLHSVAGQNAQERQLEVLSRGEVAMRNNGGLHASAASSLQPECARFVGHHEDHAEGAQGLRTAVQQRLKVGAEACGGSGDPDVVRIQISDALNKDIY